MYSHTLSLGNLGDINNPKEPNPLANQNSFFQFQLAICKHPYNIIKLAMFMYKKTDKGALRFHGLPLP